MSSFLSLRFKTLRISGIWVGILFFVQLALCQTLPPPPTQYVLDEPHILSDKTLRSLQALFLAHDRATSEQIVFAIFNTTSGEDPVLWTNRIFQAWKLGQKGKDNGVLLALYWKEHKARLEVGYGLESLLTDAKSKSILANVLAPALKQGRPDSALTLTAIEILKILQSPLIKNGEAEKILQGLKISHSQFSSTPEANSWVWIALGIILFFLIGRMIFISREQSFDRNTWHPIVFFPFRHRRGRKSDHDDFFGGGGFGGPSDFGSSGSNDSGGFRGGGGSSGGGGASQDW